MLVCFNLLSSCIREFNRCTGFVALAIEGSYDVLAVVDQTHLPTKVKDRVTGATLGSTYEVKMKSKIKDSSSEYVVALL
jgi:hypothetical protein